MLKLLTVPVVLAKALGRPGSDADRLPNVRSGLLASLRLIVTLLESRRSSGLLAGPKVALTEPTVAFRSCTELDTGWNVGLTVTSRVKLPWKFCTLREARAPGPELKLKPTVPLTWSAVLPPAAGLSVP